MTDTNLSVGSYWANVPMPSSQTAIPAYRNGHKFTNLRGLSQFRREQ